GVTCPCNLICLCKFHHDLKTFGLWDPEYQPDGSVTWNSPTGREYTVQTREWPTGLADVRTTRETEGPTNESDGASEITRDRRRHPDIAGKAAASEDGSPGREVPPVDDVEPPF